MKIYFCIFVLLLTFTHIRSECCGSYRVEYDMKAGYPCNHIVGGSTNSGSGLHCQIHVCKDGRHHQGKYCGKGSCNIFGCNCSEGCFIGNSETPDKNFLDNYSEFVEWAQDGNKIEGNKETKENQ